MNVLYFAAGIGVGVMLVGGIAIRPEYFAFIIPSALCLLAASLWGE